MARRTESRSTRLLSGALVVVGLAVVAAWLCVEKYDPLVVATLCAVFAVAATILVCEFGKSALKK